MGWWVVVANRFIDIWGDIFHPNLLTEGFTFLGSPFLSATLLRS